MRIHHEGVGTILIVSILFALCIFIAYYFSQVTWVRYGVLTISLLCLATVLHFFRVPNRDFLFDDNAVVSPANGEIVIVKEVMEKEYFNLTCMQVSIFMSPLNVHLNRYPICGKIVYSKYHPGKYLVAWAPKSSEVNERHSVVIKNERTTILVKQIAGFLARRIINYAKMGEEVKQNDELGFIKFGSRVDLFLPLGTEINVQVGDKTIEGVTTIAKL